jgi:POT family proton-dependent oligopeptide transporter
MTTITGKTDVTAPRRDVFGHPRGLVVLAGTEFWDRVSFHGMQALLTLYLAGQLFTPGHIEKIVGFAGFRAVVEAVFGHLTTLGLATQIFGLYVGLAMFTPVFGGLIGDLWLGRKRMVAIGALLMTAGHFCMAFDQSFLLAMLLLILGTGALRGNLLPQVGELYRPEDARRDTAFQLYYAMVNLGAFVAPLVTGALAQTFSWHVGFAFAGFGMLAGLVVYLAGQSQVIVATPKPVREKGTTRVPLTTADWRRVAALLALVPVAALFWIAQSQVWNTYNLWVRDHVQLHIGSFLVPVPWFQAIDGLSPFVCLPPMLMFWRWQAAHDREPGQFAKAAIGCFIFAAGTLWLAAAGFAADADGRAPLLWAVMFHLISNLGWLYFTPTMVSLFTRAAPVSVIATLVGLNMFSTTLGSFASGRLGSLYETLSAAQFWALHAALVGLGGVIFLLIGWRFGAAYGITSPAPDQP